MVGATGRTGAHLVRELLARDLAVRALIRNPAGASPRLDAADPGRRADRVTGDVLEPTTLPPALAGARAVICAIGTSTFWGANGARTVDYQGVANLAAAAARTPGIERFVLVSSMGVTHRWHFLNAFNQLLRWKLEGENALRASGPAYTIVRPGGLRDAPGGRALRLTQGDRRRVGWATRADVARVCVDALLNPATCDTTFEVVNARSASVPLAAQFAQLRPDRHARVYGR